MTTSLNPGRSEVITRCPAPEELLDYALGRQDGNRAAAFSRHLQSCDACRQRVDDARAIAAELHSVSVASASSGCLDDDAIAALADGGDRNVDNNAISHLATCANCRARVAAVARLMDDATVAAEIRALEPARLPLPRWSRRPLAISGGLAAAAVATFVLLSPATSVTRTDVAHPDIASHREPAITITAGPRIVSPMDNADVGDALRWSKVPQADLYRVRIWNDKGSVVWSTETRDTKVALPAVVQPGTSYLWEVSARTGWDRWVSSDLVEFTLRSRTPR